MNIIFIMNNEIPSFIVSKAQNGKCYIIQRLITQTQSMSCLTINFN